MLESILVMFFYWGYQSVTFECEIKVNTRDNNIYLLCRACYTAYQHTVLSTDADY